MGDHINMAIIVVYVVEKGQSLYFSHIVFDTERQNDKCRCQSTYAPVCRCSHSVLCDSLFLYIKVLECKVSMTLRSTVTTL